MSERELWRFGVTNELQLAPFGSFRASIQLNPHLLSFHLGAHRVTGEQEDTVTKS